MNVRYIYHLACIDEIWCLDTKHNIDKCVDKYYEYQDKVGVSKKYIKQMLKQPHFNTYKECSDYREKLFK